jgi:diguanylate cyclase (GGDEF)-like protein
LNSFGKHFWWTSVIATSVTLGTLLGLHEWHSRRLIVEAESRANLQMVQTLGNIIWPKHSEFIQRAKTLPKDQLAAQPEQAKLLETVRSAVRESPVMKVKIFDPKTAITIFSTEAKQIGDNKHGSPGLIAALAGEKNAELTFREKFNALNGVVTNRDLFASYVPFYESGRRPDGSPDMIIEIYTDVTDLLISHKTSRAQIVLGLTAALSLMYLVIFFFGRRTTKTLKETERRRKRMDAKIRQQAYHDSLTGLPNRACFIERLRATNESDNLNVLFIQLDRFKLVTDRLGHNAGDAVLAIIGKRLKATLLPGDQLFRAGVDSFVLLQKDDELLHGHLLAQKVVREIAAAFNIEGAEVAVTASVGLARWPLDDATLEGAVRCADIAMDTARRAGSNQLAVFRTEMRDEIDAETKLLSDLKLAHTNSEFILNYQPRLCAKNRGIESVEALIRWNHPQHGLLYPDRFITALEESPLIAEVGRWVLETACKQAMLWRNEGIRNLHVSVNVAPKQFRQTNFVSTVVSVLKKTGFPASDLELELTEGQLIDDLEAAIDVLTQLKDLGVSIAIDDFGTGYSSLSYLHRLPIDCLKIDRSFVNDIGAESRHGNIAQTITILAHKLGLSVVAEGVETSAQAAALTQWGCEQLQGYLFSKPVPAEDISAMLAQPVLEAISA